MENYSDLFIIGGGINGTAIAADAAGRGLSVTLCEKNDLASGTSSASSKLIHGGLRYLEFYEFGLVKKALQEREILLRRAPHLVTPLEFVLPHEKHSRPAWFIRIGLYIYDHLAKRQRLPGSKTVHLQKDPRGNKLLPHLTKGFSYYDCFTDDSRFVVLNAISAKENGANILTNTQFLSAKRENNHWKIQCKDTRTQITSDYYAKALLNIGGPWIQEIQDTISGSSTHFDIELDKGSHIVVPKMYEGDFAYILQNIDNRIVFAIPFQNKYTLIGTTDVKYHDNLDKVAISSDEEEYLCQAINSYFKNAIHRKDIVWSYAGVRCLQATTKHSAAMASRDFKCHIDVKESLPLLTMIGGKLTTHRTLAEDVLDQLGSYFPDMGQAWTATKPLPGGDIPGQDFSAFYQTLKKQFSWLSEELVLRYAKNYGTRIFHVLKEAKTLSDLGTHLGHGLYQKEVDYLIHHEWARTWDDILWRRTKLGLVFTKNEIDSLKNTPLLLESIGDLC